MTPTWSRAIARLTTELHTDPPYEDDGVTVVPIRGEASCERIVELLPGAWSLIGLHETSEVSSAVLTCPEHLGVFAFSDHFQAGLFGAIEACRDEGSFAKKSREALARYAREPEPE